MASRSVNIADIVVKDRLRDLDPDWVKGLAVSMAQIGLRQPILVGRSGGKHPLIAGLHRLEAAKLLGWTEIEGIVCDDNEQRRRVVEIDENLMRRELSALDRDAFLAERHALYLQEHPETAGGKAGAVARWAGLPTNYANEKISFASDAAEKLGISRRSVELAIKRHKGLSPAVRSRVATTWLADHASALSAIARRPKGEQLDIVRAMLRDEKPCRTVADALVDLKIVKRSTDKVTKLGSLTAAWSKASTDDQDQFLRDRIAALPGRRRNALCRWLVESGLVTEA